MKRAVVTRPRWLLLVVALAVPVTAQQGTPPVRLDLHQLVEQALAANPGLRAAAQADRAARMQARAAALSRLGRVEGLASYSRYEDDQIVRPMSRQLFRSGAAGLPFDDEQTHYGVSYELPLYLGGHLKARIRIARLAAGRTAALLEGSRWQLRFNATSLFAGAIALDSTATALAELQRSLGQTRRRLELMVAQGKRPRVDQFKVLDQVAQARAQRAAVAADSARVRGLLAALLNRPAANWLTLAPLPSALPRLKTAPDQLPAALGNASVMRRAKLAARRAREQVSLARADFLPHITARANAFQHDGPDIAGGPLSSWEVTVGASLPLFTGGARLAALSAARAREHAARARLDQTRLQQEARLAAALAQLEAARSSVDALRQRRQATGEAARIEQIRYDTGAGTIEDLLRARSRQQAARAELARAIGGVWVAAAQINLLVEEEIVR